MKRRCFFLIVMLLSVFLFVCCADDIPPSSEGEQQGEVAIRIGWWGSRERHDSTLAVISMYEQKASIKIEPDFSSLEQYISKLNTLIASHDSYDIMQFDGNFTSYLPYIEPLDSYIEKGIIDVSGISEEYYGITEFGGKTVGIPIGLSVPVVAYDPAIFAEAGVGLPEHDWTWKQYEQAAIQIYERLGIMGFAPMDEYYFFVHSQIIQSGPPQGTYAENLMLTDFFDMKLRLNQIGVYPTYVNSREADNVENGYLVHGESAMQWIMSNQFAAISTAAARELKITSPPAAYPAAQQDTYIYQGQMFCIYNESKYKDEAARFISYFINDIKANRILDSERGVPVVESVREAMSRNNKEPQSQVYEYFEKLPHTQAARLRADLLYDSKIKEAYAYISQELMQGNLTSLEAVELLRAAYQDILLLQQGDKTTAPA